MKTLKKTFLLFCTFFFSIFHLNAALYDCGCSFLFSTGYGSVSYQSTEEDCCEQTGYATLEFFDFDGTLEFSMPTSTNQSGKCYDC